LGFQAADFEAVKLFLALLIVQHAPDLELCNWVGNTHEEWMDVVVVIVDNHGFGFFLIFFLVSIILRLFVFVLVVLRLYLVTIVVLLLLTLSHRRLASRSLLRRSFLCRCLLR